MLEFRTKMARLYRRIEERHLSSAKLHELHAIRMEKWLNDPGMLRPVFMAAVAATLGVRGATTTLHGRRHTAALVTASDSVARAAHDLEIVLGEGPAVTATAECVSIQLAGAALLHRWPRYGHAVAELGVRAVVAAPLRGGTECLGALCAYDDEPIMKNDVLATTDRIASTLTQSVLRITQAEDPGGIITEHDYQAVIHQAIGMISVYRGCGVGDAEALLRARAYSDGRPVSDVAQDVVRGRTRLSDCDDNTGNPATSD